uniref:CCHC-type domain-containing protein n=1 Tax=Globodera pallida TaxID=36090 RepID=A0A183BR49_GLOPA
MPVTSYPTGSGVHLACGPEAVNVNERDGQLSGVPLACEPEAAIVNKRNGEVTSGASARKFWQGKMSAKVPEVEKVHPKKNERTIYGINMLSSGLSAISSLEMFGEESAAEFDDWAERFKDHLTVSGKNFTDQEKVTRFKLCLKDAPRALFKELSPAQTTTLDLAMSALRAKLDSPQRREIAKRTLTLCRQREDESVAQFLRRLMPLIEATNHSLTEAQRKEKVCEEFLDRLKPSMSFLIRLIGLTQAKSLDVVKAQAEELEALLLANKGNEVSRLSQTVNVINSRPSQPQWSAGPSHGAAGNEQGSSGNNMQSAGPFSAPNVQRQPPSFGGARGGARNWAQGRQEQVSQSNWSGDRQCQYCGQIGHLAYACQERQADFEDDQGRAVEQAEWVDQQPRQPQMGWQNSPNSAEVPPPSTTSEGFMEDLVRALVEMNVRSNTGRSAPEEGSDQRR